MRRGVQNAVENDGGGGAGKGNRAGGHFVEHHAERKQIRARVEFFAAGLLRRHVGDRAHRAAGAGELLVAEHADSRCAWRWRPRIRRREASTGVSFARPKSRIFAWPRSTRKILAGLMSRWTMPLACAASSPLAIWMPISSSSRNLEGLAGDAVLEGLALQQLHGDERAAFEFADVVNGADVGVIEGGGGASFAAEAFDGLRVLRNFVREKFQRDVAAEARVLGFVDHAHATAAEFFEDVVVGDGSTDDRGSVGHWAGILRERWVRCKRVPGV